MTLADKSIAEDPDAEAAAEAEDVANTTNVGYAFFTFLSIFVDEHDFLDDRLEHRHVYYMF